MQIRNATLADEAALFEICLLTANIGGDASALFSDPKMLGQVWAVPYLHFDPSLTFVVADGDKVWGYIVGVAQTADYEKWLDETWFPTIRPAYRGFVALTENERRTLNWINNPPPVLDARLAAYPAHLHINLLPDMQAGGWGRKLIDAFIKTLEARHVPGVHLGVNPGNVKAIGFYEHLGFADLKIGEGKTMARKL